MTTVLKLALALTVAAAAAASPAMAQDFDGSIGYGGGGIVFTDLNGGSGGESLSFGSGWVVNGHIDHWIGRGRIGGRVNGAFTRRPLQSVGDERQTHIWIVGGDLLVRLLSPTPRGSVAPFLSAGAGIVSYGLGKGEPVILGPELVRYPGDTARQFAVSGGFGIDFIPGFSMIGTPIGFRLEGIDHVALDSPFRPIDDGSFDPVHNLRVTLSVIGLVRLLR